MIDLLPHPAELRLFVSSIIRVVIIKMFHLFGHVDQINVLMYFSFSDFSAYLAPVASSLCVQYTHRTVVITGGLLAFSGMALGFFGLNMVWLYATTGFLQGMNLWLRGFLPPATYLRVPVVRVSKSGIYFDFMSSQNKRCSLKVISLPFHSGNKSLYRKSAPTKKTNI